MIKLFKKDLKLFFKDRRSVVLTFLLPIILISLFAFAFGGVGSGKEEEKPIELLVVDLDQTKASKEMIVELDSLKILEVVISKLEKAKKLVTDGDNVGVLVFYKGFQDSFKLGENMPIELLYDEAREMEIGMLQSVLVNAIMESTGKKMAMQNTKSLSQPNSPETNTSASDEIIADVSQNTINDKPEKSESSLKMTSIVGEKEDTNLGLIHAVAGTSIMMLLFSVAGFGTSILEEKENGTIKRLLYSPLNGSDILYGKMSFAFFIATLQLTVMFLFASIAFNLDLTVNVLALVLMILASAFAISSFGVFLAAVSKTRQQAQSLSTLIILIMSAIGGSMIPIFIMPAIMKQLAIFSVNYWGIQGFYDIFWRQLSLVDILPRVGVLVGIGVVMTLISMRLFKKNILKLV